MSENGSGVNVSSGGIRNSGKDMEKPRSFPVILVFRIHGDSAAGRLRWQRWKGNEDVDSGRL